MTAPTPYRFSAALLALTLLGAACGSDAATTAATAEAAEVVDDATSTDETTYL